MIIGIIFILIGLFLFFRSRKEQRTRQWSGGPEFVLRDKGEDILKHAPAPDPVRGFANMSEYLVSGKKKTTNRKNTRRVHALNEEQVRQYAISVEGLMEPLHIEQIVTPDLSSGDNEYGLNIPDGATRWDAWEFELCVVAGDTKHIPPAFMEYLTDKGVPMSWLSGRNSAAEEAFKHCDMRERAALYGYAVHCFLHKYTPGNINKEPRKELYYDFADAAARDISVYNSIAKRPGSDMWGPSRSTNAYQFAATFFEGK